MKILVIADELPSDIDLKSLIQLHQVEAVFTLGDLEGFQLKPLADISLPKFGVYGNHCSEDYLPVIGSKNLHLKTDKVGEFTVGGFEGCLRYKENGPHQFKQAESVELIKEMPPVDILLTHAPPLGLNDDWSIKSHTGLLGTLEYIKTHKPKLIFHGHTYPTNNYLSKFEETVVVYTKGYGIYDLNELLRAELPQAKRYG